MRFDYPNPVLPNVASPIVGRRIANRYFESGQGWQSLCDPMALAMRETGKGFVLVSQLHVSNLLSDLLNYSVKGAKGKPIVLLDPGDNTILSELSNQAYDFVLLQEVE